MKNPVVKLGFHRAMLRLAVLAERLAVSGFKLGRQCN